MNGQNMSNFQMDGEHEEKLWDKIPEDLEKPEDGQRKESFPMDVQEMSSINMPTGSMSNTFILKNGQRRKIFQMVGGQEQSDEKHEIKLEDQAAHTPRLSPKNIVTLGVMPVVHTPLLGPRSDDCIESGAGFNTSRKNQFRNCVQPRFATNMSKVGRNHGSPNM